jgi:hypothetical protein
MASLCAENVEKRNCAIGAGAVVATFAGCPYGTTFSGSRARRRPQALGTQKGDKPVGQRFLIMQLTFPNGENSPTRYPEPSQHLSVSGHRSPAFGFPKTRPGFRGAPAPPASMHVPKAAMHKDYATPSWKHDVWGAREVVPVQAKTEP